MQRTIGLGLLLVTSIVGIALAQNHHHGDATAGKADPTASAFTTQMMQAMDRMDAGMMAAKPTGDPDRDFAAMMIPNHQGAVDMAKLQLIYGRDRAGEKHSRLPNATESSLGFHPTLATPTESGLLTRPTGATRRVVRLG